ncbi:MULTISPECIES: PilW family protein [unclassified Variovorax]|uniref:PilW family protein n=1 Tax=unclassified Variovorax TaxID=663243 RepID=UPI001316DB27|nr:MULTISPECIES: PilW family protein [unclassified Variovorax]VTU18503.1 Tfp pilus assembly protein PilW [Variovorax sp. SRS16]VTU26708.1 Tfp pilus assembly protein PilW [Variovorax sp. PBL-E5]
MISIALGLVVLGALFAIYISTQVSSRQATSVARMDEDAAVALSVIGLQLRMAGFSIPRVFAAPGAATVNGASVPTPDRNFSGAGVRACDRGFVDPTVDFDLLACAPGSTGAAALAIRFEGADPDDIPSVQALLPPARDCLNQAVGANATGALGVPYTLIESRYQVRIGARTGTPELYCGGNGSKIAYQSQAILQYVEDMTVGFGIADDGQSKAVERYVDDAASVEALPGSVDQRWSRVVSVKLCIVLRSGDPSPDAAGSYLDCRGKVAPSSDHLIRRAYSSVFTLRNRGGFAATAP